MNLKTDFTLRIFEKMKTRAAIKPDITIFLKDKETSVSWLVTALQKR